jgi:hypothetical protein
MSTQDQVNSYYQEYILYYCNSVNSDPTVYDYNGLSDVCSVAYDSNTPPQIVISGWLIGGYSQPSNATLLTYSFSTVDSFFQNFYVIPAAIQLAQPYTISTSNLNNVIPHSSMLGYLVFDSTVHALKFWNGSNWIVSSSLFLKLDGSSTMSGNLNLGSNNIVSANNISQSTPSCISIWTSASSGISFTANTPKVVSLGSFSQALNPNSDFSYDSSTGQITYTGSVTRYFRITSQYSIAALAVASTHTNYLSKNGSTSISGQRVVNTFLLLGQANTSAYSLSDIIQLAQNDTIQLGGESSTTSTVTYSNISYSISAL